MSGLRRIFVALSLLLTACGDDGEVVLAKDIYAPLGEILPTATDEQRETFARGLEVFNRRFTEADGLGPEFNVTFCGSCHEKPVPGGSAGRYRNFLLTGQTLSDGSFTPTGKDGVLAHFTLDALSRHSIEVGTNVLATRNPIPFFGSGLIAEITEESILANEDEDDTDGDGISGRANFDRGFVGRFGRKAQTVSIEGFIRGPLFNHLGITTDPLSDERRDTLPVAGVLSLKQAQAAAPDESNSDADDAVDPELSESDLFDLVSFAQLLAAPQPTTPNSNGEFLFWNIGCVSCHVATLESPRGLLPLYSDLLLHDMGDDLADDFPMKLASGREFKTTPLWGVAAVGPFLHDGRADTLHEAIMWHGGEAQAAQARYADLSAGEQDDVIEFLESLGGLDQLTRGLLPPGAPIADVGDYGGPRTELASVERDLFLQGREVFDRDFSVSQGAGPVFNGDSCRACHFEPVIGGAGPAGVNVIRQGIENLGVFTFPSEGTLVHRFDLADRRPTVSELANVFEMRQTPTVFGLGLIERVSNVAILSFADPNDADADGISGRAHVLSSGKIGKLGWKANVPDLQSFARDAMGAELGITVSPGAEFGSTADSDDAPDPELSDEELAALVFYMQNLAPPPRRSVNAAAETAGEATFTSIGCSDCHVPNLFTVDGEPVALFSDLLLHDVAPPDAVGIEEGDAGMREFRTPPLWGISTSGPYMHDGRAFTLEDAIAAHFAEAQNSVTAYQGLSDDERTNLMAFLESL